MSQDVTARSRPQPEPEAPRPGNTARPPVSSRPVPSRPVPYRPVAVFAVLLGTLGFLVSVLGSWIPSFWGDEAASVMSAERPWSSLFTMFGHVDAVHGAYYIFLHLWIDLFGASPFSMRLPSALAIGIATAGVVVLANRLSGRRTAVVAGIVFLILPCMTDMGSEARSYALSTACATWLTVLLVHLLRTRNTKRLAWLGYAVLYAISIYVFLYLAMMAIVHAVILLTVLLRRGDGQRRLPGRRLAVRRLAVRRLAVHQLAVHQFALRRLAVHPLVWRWLAAVGVGVLLAAPVLVYGIAQHGQISWIGRRPPMTFDSFFAQQWFRSGWLALAAWALIAALAVASAVSAVTSTGTARRMSRQRRAGGHGADGLEPAASEPAASESADAPGAADIPGTPTLLAVAGAWLVIPPVLLLLADALIAPAYTIRYTSFVAPAVALLIGAALCVLTRRMRARTVLVAIAVACLAALAAPAYLAQRGPYAKDGGSDWAQVAATISKQAHAGDAVIFGAGDRPSRDPRLAMHTYPDAFRGLVDVTVTVPYSTGTWLGDATKSITQSADRIARTDGRVWLIRYVKGEGAHSSAHQFGELRRLGYSLVRTLPQHRDTIYLLVRGGAQ